jgi:pimeloyl-ACP methyl ester carboxylesterase
MISKHTVFRTTIVVLICTAAIVFVSPFLNVNGLIYPARIDSVYFSQQENLYEKHVLEGEVDSGRIFIYNPGEIGIRYRELIVQVDDGVYLHGWLAGDTIEDPTASLIMIPDISESRIHYLKDIKEFVDRGFRVCVIELRGQGNSDGRVYSIGQEAANDISLLIDHLEISEGFTDIAIMGNRTGAAVAMQVALDDPRIDVLVAKNPFISFGSYFTDYAQNYWGPWVLPLCRIIKRDAEHIIGFHPDSLNLSLLTHFIEKPSLYVAANFYTENVARETTHLYNASEASRKKLIIDRGSVFSENGFGNSKQYYDRISAFIASSFPPREKRSRFGKLVLKDRGLPLVPFL